MDGYARIKYVAIKTSEGFWAGRADKFTQTVGELSALVLFPNEKIAKETYRQVAARRRKFGLSSIPPEFETVRVRADVVKFQEVITLGWDVKK